MFIRTPQWLCNPTIPQFNRPAVLGIHADYERALPVAALPFGLFGVVLGAKALKIREASLQRAITPRPLYVVNLFRLND